MEGEGGEKRLIQHIQHIQLSKSDLMSRLELYLKDLKHNYRHRYISKRKIKMNLEDKGYIIVLHNSQVSGEG